MKTMKKSISIQASKEKVWDVLLNDKYTRIWYAEFSEGTHAETDWKEGSKVVFSDNTKSGLIGTIITNKANEMLSVEYHGVLENGKEEYGNAGAEAMKGFIETYRLSEKSGSTHLSIECDMGEDYFESMSASWEKALQKIKALAETK
jgi:hypothetical protein